MPPNAHQDAGRDHRTGKGTGVIDRAAQGNKVEQTGKGFFCRHSQLMEKDCDVGMPIGHRPGFVPVVDPGTGNPLGRIGRIIDRPEKFFGGPAGRRVGIVFCNLVERSGIRPKRPFFLFRIGCDEADTGTAEIPDRPDMQRISLFDKKNLSLPLDNREGASLGQAGFFDLPDRRPGGDRHAGTTEDPQVSDTQGLCSGLNQGDRRACGVKKASGRAGGSGLQNPRHQLPEGHVIIAFGGEEEIEIPAGWSPESAVKIREGVGRRIGNVGGGRFFIPGPREDRRPVDGRDIPDGRQGVRPEGSRREKIMGYQKNAARKGSR